MMMIVPVMTEKSIPKEVLQVQDFAPDKLVPALASSHAIEGLLKLNCKDQSNILVSLSWACYCCTVQYHTPHELFYL